jgi:hypothetical protein
MVQLNPKTFNQKDDFFNKWKINKKKEVRNLPAYLGMTKIDGENCF